MMRRLLFLSIVLGTGAAMFAQENEAYSAEGYTSIEYDASTNTVTAYSETSLATNISGFYAARLYVSVTDQNGTDYTPYCTYSTGSVTSKSVTCEFDGSPNDTYTITADHRMYLTNQDFVCPSGGLGCGEYWRDYFNFSYFQYHDVLMPFEDVWEGDGPEQDYLDDQELPVGGTQDTAQITTPSACGDTRDTIISDYTNYGTPYRPTCDAFTTDSNNAIFPTGNIESSETGAYKPWGIIPYYFLSGMTDVWNETGPFTINSAYRDPQAEIRVAQSVGQTPYMNSRHIAGDAVDISTDVNSWGVFQTAGHNAGACVEPAEQQGDYNHAHLDWRPNSLAMKHTGCPAKW